ncbi:hypothetical protein F5Y16DRAFT_91178 [Xylariaceae sp. FL0255]|nr:hypothetical protein F5Y16DRAFT_91178 [Xylariaceae sp. FL0255]
MNNHNIRKRRPHGHHEAPAVVPVAHHPSPFITTSTSAGLSLLDVFSQDEINILHQAATVLNCSLPQLYSLDNRHHSTHHLQYTTSPSYNISCKRPRLIIDGSTMPSRGRSPSLDQGPYDPQTGPLTGFTAGQEPSRLTQCLASFTVCSPCITCDPQGYASIPAPTSYETYEYGEARPFLQPRLAPSLPPPSSLPQDQSNVFSCGDSAVAWQTFQNYPSLQTDRSITQPMTSHEEMVYPEPVPIQGYAEQCDVHSSSSSSASSQVGGATPYSTLAQGPSGGMRRYSAIQSRSQAQMSIEDNEHPVPRSPGDLDIVQPNQRPPPSKRGPFKDPRDREKTAETRRIGSCIRCRMQRIRCEANPADKLGVCLTCQKVSSGLIWRLPCLRYKITDVKLFKPGQVKGYEWTKRWNEGGADDILNWASTETKQVKLTEGYIQATVNLRVRQFIPVKDDKLRRTWVVNGVTREVEIPAYAIVNLEEAKGIYSNYINHNIADFCRSALSGKDKLLVGTYSMAIRIVRDAKADPKEKEALKKALQLWMAVRMTTRSTVIVGEETLGMRHDIMDETSSLQGKIPLPPVMGAQIELVLIHQIQSTLRREILEHLQSMTQANKQQTWFVTYLITFILLHNVALLCHHDAGYAKKHGMKTRFAREGMVREYQTGANILLAYFHYCNKGIFPFSMKCKDQDLRNLAGLDDPRTNFIRTTRLMIEKHRPSWVQMRQANDYGNDLYYISQLYQENWEPQATI